MYYAREKYYQHVQTEIVKVQKEYGLEPIYIYWKAYGLVMSGKLLLFLLCDITKYFPPLF